MTKKTALILIYLSFFFNSCISIKSQGKQFYKKQFENINIGYFVFNTISKTIFAKSECENLLDTKVTNLKMYQINSKGIYSSFYDTTFLNSELLTNFKFKFDTILFNKFSINNNFEIIINTTDSNCAYVLELKKTDLLENKFLQFTFIDYIKDGQRR